MSPSSSAPSSRYKWLQSQGVGERQSRADRVPLAKRALDMVASD